MIKAVVLTVNTDDKVKCYLCGAEKNFEEAIDSGWSVMAFKNKHECDTCKKLSWYERAEIEGKLGIRDW